jgi:hypothetical protein
MNTRYIDFIGMYENVFPDGFCNHMIEEFERLLSSGLCGNRQDSEGVRKYQKQDNFYFLNVRRHSFSDFNNNTVIEIFLTGLQNCFDEYTEEFDILKDIPLNCSKIKMQKTSPGGGYHLWHSEKAGDQEADGRCLVYSAYLNTIEEAGETEFLYQRIRIPPKENTMILWPASFTHTHRGNVVHGNKSKYIITGWFYLE